MTVKMSLKVKKQFFSSHNVSSSYDPTMIAMPMVAWGIPYWLQGFAYRTELSLDIFLLPILIVLLIAALTVTGLTLRAARSNPVEALRYE